MVLVFLCPVTVIKAGVFISKCAGINLDLQVYRFWFSLIKNQTQPKTDTIVIFPKNFKFCVPKFGNPTIILINQNLGCPYTPICDGFYYKCPQVVPHGCPERQTIQILFSLSDFYVFRLKRSVIQ